MNGTKVSPLYLASSILTLSLIPSAAVALPRDGFVDDTIQSTNNFIAQSTTTGDLNTSPAAPGNCPAAVQTALNGLNVSYGCLPNVDIDDIRSGCSPVPFDLPAPLRIKWIYPALCGAPLGAAGTGGAVDLALTNNVPFNWTNDYFSWVTPKDNRPPVLPLPSTGTRQPAANEYLPSDQQGPAYNFQHADNTAGNGIAGLQVHVHFVGSMNRFVLRVPSNWDGQTLIVAASNGLASEHTYDRTVSDWAVGNGIAYMGSNKGSYSQTVSPGKWSIAAQRYLPLLADNVTIDDAACQFAPDTYFNPIFISEGPPADRQDFVLGVQNNHKFVHIPSLENRQASKNVIMSWRDSFIDSVKLARQIILAHKGVEPSITIAYGVSAGGGVAKSVAEYAEAPATKFVDGVIEVAGIQLSTDSNNIMNVYNALIQNWDSYVNSPGGNGEALSHFDRTGTGYGNILAAGFPADLINVNSTGLQFYATSFPGSPRRDWPIGSEYWAHTFRSGGLYLEWTMNANAYFLQCMFIRGFDPTYTGPIEAYPLSRISDSTSDVYQRLQLAGAHTGNINAPVISMGGSDDSFSPPQAFMYPYHNSIPATSTQPHRTFEYLNAGHVDVLASGPISAPAFQNNSWNMHFMANRSRVEIVNLLAFLQPDSTTTLAPSQCIHFCNTVSTTTGSGPCGAHQDSLTCPGQRPLTRTEWGIPPGIHVPDIMW